MSLVNRNGKHIRPAWNYAGGETSTAYSTLEMMESTRNVLEQIRQSQMLQCDVAHAIKDMAATLRRIDRRLKQVESLKVR